LADKGWKQFERRVAAALGGRRRGADTSHGRDGGKSDIIHPRLAPECKLLARPGWADFVSAIEQAERNADGKIPIAVVKRGNALDKNAIVAIRLDKFVEHFLEAPSPNPEDLLALSLDAGIARKNEAGREKYGPVWSGAPPLIEAYSECLDLFNYAREALRRRDLTPDEYGFMVGLLDDLTAFIRERARKRNGPPVEDERAAA
jgi:hypothetical protein